MNILKIFYGCFILCLLLMISQGFAEEYATDSSAPDSSITFGAEADFNSRYVWRGIPFSKDAVMQSSVWISASDFTLTLWNNFVLNHEPNHGQVNEFDLTLGYYKEWNKFSIEPSFNYYWYPNQEEAPATGELIVKFAYAINCLELFTNQNIDLIEYPGAYFGDIGIGYTRELNPLLTFESSISLGWGSSKFNDTYLEISKTALNVAQCDIAVTYQPENCIYIRPHIAVSTILDHELKEQLDDSTIVYGGIAIGKEF
jgi:hypothetical protein